MYSSHSESKPQSAAAQGWSGTLQLSFARRHSATQIIHRHAQAPLKLQRPFYPEGPDVCHGVMLHTAGGIAGGDRLKVDLTLDDDAQVVMTSAAAGKVYRSAGKAAHQTSTISLGPRACLEWFPQETILFDGAHYRQQLQVSLAADAVWTGWDIVRLGRSARGESFHHGTWRSTTVVTRSGIPVWVDRQGLNGDSELLTGPTGLNHGTVIGTFAAIGGEVPRSLLDGCRQWPLRHQLTESGAGEEFGATRLMAGVLCRYRGSSTARARAWFEAVWALVRHHYRQRPPCRPRVWL